MRHAISLDLCRAQLEEAAAAPPPAVGVGWWWRSNGAVATR